MLLPQVQGKAFVDVLAREFGTAERADVATAWVRASGVGLLWEDLTGFLKRGGILRAVVGIDRDNTSVEGLQLLLQLTGDVKIWVRHNEASVIYHPKLYAFRTQDECKIFVGSNNLTGAGLVSNEEVSGILVEGRHGDLEKSFNELMTILRDTSENLTKPLDNKLLQELENEGYIGREASLRGKAANQAKTRPPGARLFGSKAPARRKIKASFPLMNSINPELKSPTSDWKRVLVKLRISRGTQAQLPVPVAREVRRRLGKTEVDGPIEAVVRNSNAVRMISPTYAKRNPNNANTYKFEAIVPAPDEDVVLMLELIGDRVMVEVVGTADPAGKLIEDFILAGLKTDPIKTIASNKRVEELGEDPEGITLYRYD